ncbi:hypothetical protein BVY01_01015, partial [bacterium I07]
FISSADLMQRNLDHRVEVTCPIYDASIQNEIRAFLDFQFRDNVKARLLNENFDNHINPGTKNGEQIRAQFDFYDWLLDRHSRQSSISKAV